MVRISMMSLVAAVCLWSAGVAAATDAEKRAVLKTYADIAHATYEDSLVAAKSLRKAVAALVAAPSAKTLDAARQAWLAARVPYQQSEAFRFGNPVVDDWEGKVNAWPLDEGLIDYVDGAAYGSESDENPLYVANVIGNASFKMSGKTIDASTITKSLLADELHEVGDIEANVATGYHAIEFLLWGQDLNGTGPGAGARPATDFDTKACTGGNCERRAAYLTVATDLLIDDLTWITAQWAPDGPARTELLSGSGDAGLARILTGLGSLSYGELAGERMKLGLMLHDPEEEHDCFSDNTHNSHYYNLVGMRNVYTGRYARIDGRKVAGASLSALVAGVKPTANKAMLAGLDATKARMDVMVATAEKGKAYDQMLSENDPAGNKIVQDVVDALTDQTKAIEQVVAALGIKPIEFEGSDSLDNPSAVQQ